MYMTWQVLEPQVMSDMHRCCVMLLWSDCVRCFCCTSGALPGRPALCVDLGRKWEWLPLHAPYSLWTVGGNKKKKKIPRSIIDQSSEKKSQVCGDLWRPCVRECGCGCVAGGEGHTDEKKTKEQQRVRHMLGAFSSYRQIRRGYIFAILLTDFMTNSFFL